MIPGKIYLCGAKFRGVEEKSGVKDGKPWAVKEAQLFIPEFGPVKIRVYDKHGKPTFPAFGETVDVELSPGVSKYRECMVIWDHETKFVRQQA